MQGAGSMSNQLAQKPALGAASGNNTSLQLEEICNSNLPPAVLNLLRQQARNPICAQSTPLSTSSTSVHLAPPPCNRVLRVHNDHLSDLRRCSFSHARNPHSI